ncbi:MAG: hypothetical protein M5U26_16730 [Planctomycetota bacterium]|nr:hypothetical protein [Planctomycetota bacterium]
MRRLLMLVLSLLSAAGLDAARASAPEPPRAEEPPAPSARELEASFSTAAARWTFKAGGAEASRRLERAAEPPWDLRRIEALETKALTKLTQGTATRLRWLVESRAGGLYAAAQAVVVPSAGAPAPVRVRFDAGDLAPVGHGRPWDELAAAEVVALELRAETTGSPAKPLEVALREPRLIPRERPAEDGSRIVLDAALEPVPPGLEAAAALVFRLEPLPADPFADEGDGDVRVQGGGFEVLAFLDQDFLSVRDGSAWRQVPVGLPFYRAYLPRPPADGMVRIRSGERSWALPLAALTTRPARAEPAGPGRWRPALKTATKPLFDPTAERLWAGAPEAWRFEPAAGLWQVAPAEPETQAWRPVPFWTASWGRFGGSRRPDFTLAARMDAELAEAAGRGERLPLVLLDGESFARQGTFNWPAHPLNAAQGGPLQGPGELMHTPEGLAFCRRAARYALARWGASKAVDSYLLTVRLNAPGAAELHAQLGAAARRWPLREKPLVSLHPLAREPRTTTEIALWDDDARKSGGAWRSEEHEATRVRLVAGEEGAGAAGAALEIRGGPGETAVTALKPFRLAGADWRAPAPDNFHAADALCFEVWLPPGAPGDLRAGVHLRDRDDLWYQALLPGLLRAGDWSTCLLDLRGANAQGLEPVRHTRPWSEYGRGRIRELGLHLYSTHPDTPVLARVRGVRAVRFDSAALEPPARLALLEEPARQRRVGEAWTCHLAFGKAFDNPFDPEQVELEAVIETPSGKSVRVPAFFDQPCRRSLDPKTGRERVEPDGAERWTVRYRVLEPGAHRVRFELYEHGQWKVSFSEWSADYRFSPEGRPYKALPRNADDWVYTYEQYSQDGRRKVERVKWERGTLTARLEGAGFEAAPAGPGWRGFVRPDEDGRHFKFDDGSFYYALGPCLRSPGDDRLPFKDPKWEREILPRVEKRGTYQFDDYFEAFEKAKINWARMWLCSWWGGLQWRRDWPGYQGLGRYNLLNAWRVDHVLDDAERKGIYLSLCLTNHGQFSYAIDTEWEHNPYGRKFGGPLESSAEFFTRADAKALHLNYLRYAVARWGHSPAVLAWDLFSELEFTDEYRPSLGQIWKGIPDHPAPHIASWHQGMSKYLKSVDPNRHTVATHFSHPVRGMDIFQLPEIEIAASNAYSAFEELAEGNNDAAAALADFWNGNDWARGVFRGMKQYRKPVLVEEQGRHWLGVKWEKGELVEHNTRDELDADLHAGLWGSLVQPLAGATGYWWWLHVHFDDRYFEYRALAAYLGGEDLRAQAGERALEPELLPVRAPGEAVLARALRSDRRAYVWVYHAQTPQRTTNIPPVSGAVLVLPNLRAGRYKVEFWDTREGKRVGERDVQTADPPRRGEAGGALAIELPRFHRDLALKVKEWPGQR